MMNKEAEMARAITRGIAFLMLFGVAALGWYGLLMLIFGS